METPKKTAGKITKVTDAWTNLAPDKSFGAMTLDDFKKRVQPSLDNRASLETAKNARINAQSGRSSSDADSLLAISQVVAGIKADPTEGENSALYEACGYIPKSKKKSGLSRKKTAKTAVAQVKAS